MRKILILIRVYKRDLKFALRSSLIFKMNCSIGTIKFYIISKEEIIYHSVFTYFETKFVILRSKLRVHTNKILRQFGGKMKRYILVLYILVDMYFQIDDSYLLRLAAAECGV